MPSLWGSVPLRRKKCRPYGVPYLFDVRNAVPTGFRISALCVRVLFVYNQVAYWAMNIDTSSLLDLLDVEELSKIQSKSSDSTTTFLHSGEINILPMNFYRITKIILYREICDGCSNRASIFLGERCRANLFCSCKAWTFYAREYLGSARNYLHAEKIVLRHTGSDECKWC